MADTNHPLDWGAAAFERDLEGGGVKVTFDRWTSPNGEPFEFYVFPIRSEELDAITRESAKGGLASHFETIIQRCKTEDRKQIFQSGHRSRLKKLTNGDDILLLSSLIHRAQPPADFNLEAALKR